MVAYSLVGAFQAYLLLFAHRRISEDKYRLEVSLFACEECVRSQYMCLEAARLSSEPWISN